MREKGNAAHAEWIEEPRGEQAEELPPTLEEVAAYLAVHEERTEEGRR